MYLIMLSCDLYSNGPDSKMIFSTKEKAEEHVNTLKAMKLIHGYTITELEVDKTHYDYGMIYEGETY